MALAVPGPGLDRVAAPAGVVDVEELAHLLFALLVLFAGESCLARATGVVGEDLHIEGRLRAISAEEGVDTDIIQIRVGLAVRSGHRLVAQQRHRVLLARCGPRVVDALVFVVQCKSLL